MRARRRRGACIVGAALATVTPVASGAPAPSPVIVGSGPPAALAAPDPARPEPATPWAAGTLTTDLDALGHLVATTTSTRPGAAGPGSGVVTITDERGGPSLTLTYPARRIDAIRLVGNRSSADPVQLAVRHCAATVGRTPRAPSCASELVGFALAGAPAIMGRQTGASADAAAAGLVDGSRQLAMVRRGHGKVASCRSTFVLRTLGGRTVRHLGRIATHDRDYPRCYAPAAASLRGRWALATVGREDENGAWETEAWALDLAARPRARWRLVAQIARGTEGSGGGGLTGPAILGDQAVWQETEWVDFSEGPMRGWLTDPAWPDTQAAPHLTVTDLSGNGPSRPITGPLAMPAVASRLAATDDAIYLATSQGILRIVPARVP